MSLEIAEIDRDGFAQIWPIFEQVIREGETYPFNRDMSERDARAMFFAPGWKNFAACEGEECVGAYFIRPNFAGPTAHIANAGYAVSPAHRGRGLAKQMCLHSLDQAREAGFRAMQFNMVVSTNPAARAAWESCRFETIGTLRQAFNHPRHGFVDANIMYRML